jgi:putative ABC transport system permease protein
MYLIQNIKTALRGIAANKMRSGLTMLGIMIGVGAVITMISIGSGASSSVTSRIQSLGSNLLMVRPGSAGMGQEGARQAAGTATTLTHDDSQAIKKEIPTVKEVSPEFSSSAQVVYTDHNINTSISGVTPEYEQVHNFHAAFGEFIRSEDQNTESKVAVLGQNVVTDLFPSGEDPIGKTIKIKNIPFRVIGVMEKKGEAGFQNVDDSVFVPLSTAQKRLFGTDNLRTISVQVKSSDAMDLADDQINALLLVRHKINNPDEADFNIMSQADILNTMGQVTNTLSLLLGGIAGISLLVGGIGIMNIMLVSVTERTREIGLRKAVGAKRKDILGQFLIESLVLSLLGGGMGLLLGFAGSFILSRIGGWPFVIALNSILLAFIFSAAVGIFFGIYPARRASLLSPIEALRYE